MECSCLNRFWNNFLFLSAKRLDQQQQYSTNYSPDTFPSLLCLTKQRSRKQMTKETSTSSSPIKNQETNYLMSKRHSVLACLWIKKSSTYIELRTHYASTTIKVYTISKTQPCIQHIYNQQDIIHVRRINKFTTRIIVISKILDM
jgi:hypothetical protein